MSERAEEEQGCCGASGLGPDPRPCARPCGDLRALSDEEESGVPRPQLAQTQRAAGLGRAGEKSTGKASPHGLWDLRGTEGAKFTGMEACEEEGAVKKKKCSIIKGDACKAGTRRGFSPTV